MSTSTDQDREVKPMRVASDEGEARWWFAALAVIKATAADTGGQMCIVEMTEPPGSEGPLHVHHREDKRFGSWKVMSLCRLVTRSSRRTRAITQSAPATSRTATRSVLQVAECFSSSLPADSKAWSGT
jgi:hypothetical protein